jgi:hypothetical protein
MTTKKLRGLRLACVAVTGNIHAGFLDDRNTFSSGHVDVTSDVLVSIIEYIGIGNTHLVSVNGELKFEISVQEIKQ